MKQKILENICRALKRDQVDESVLNRRLQEKPRGILPALSGSFVEKMQKSSARVEQIHAVSESIKVLEKIVHENHLAPRFRLANDALVDLIPFNKNWLLQQGAADASDEISVTHALCGVAETGTLVLLSSKESPTTLNFLPPIHVVLLNAKNIVSHYEDALDLISHTPRTINFISGPSRTSDIEQTAQFGAHGPKQLYVLIYQEEK